MRGKKKKKDQLQLNATIHLHLKARTCVNIEHLAFLYRLKTSPWCERSFFLKKTEEEQRKRDSCASINSPHTRQLVNQKTISITWNIGQIKHSIKWYVTFLQLWENKKISGEHNNATSINDMIRIWHHIFFHVAYMGYCQYVQVAA